jgi:hypothetical protein
MGKSPEWARTSTGYGSKKATLQRTREISSFCEMIYKLTKSQVGGVFVEARRKSQLASEKWVKHENGHLPTAVDESSHDAMQALISCT